MSTMLRDNKTSGKCTSCFDCYEKCKNTMVIFQIDVREIELSCVISWIIKKQLLSHTKSCSLHILNAIFYVRMVCFDLLKILCLFVQFRIKKKNICKVKTCHRCLISIEINRELFFKSCIKVVALFIFESITEKAKNFNNQI
jgi:hypothetical protein